MPNTTLTFPITTLTTLLNNFTNSALKKITLVTTSIFDTTLDTPLTTVTP